MQKFYEKEKIQKQKDEEEAKIRAEEEEREKARAAARAELQAETKQTINIEEQREAMKEFGGEGMVSGMEKHAAQIKETLGNGSSGEQAWSSMNNSNNKTIKQSIFIYI